MATTLPPANQAKSVLPMRTQVVVEPRFRMEVAWVGIAVLATIGVLAVNLTEEKPKVRP